MKRILFTLLLILSSSFSYSANDIGKVLLSKGQAVAISENGEVRELSRRSLVFEGDTLQTGPQSDLQVRMFDKALIALRENSELVLKEYHADNQIKDEQVLLELLEGGIRTISGTLGKQKPEDYELKTPAASIGIRGTNYEAVLIDGELSVGVWNGQIQLENEFGTLQLGDSSDFRFASVIAKQAPKSQLQAPKALSKPLIVSKKVTKEEDAKEVTTEQEKESASTNEEPEALPEDKQASSQTNDSSNENVESVSVSEEIASLSESIDAEITKTSIISALENSDTDELKQKISSFLSTLSDSDSFINQQIQDNPNITNTIKKDIVTLTEQQKDKLLADNQVILIAWRQNGSGRLMIGLASEDDDGTALAALYDLGSTIPDSAWHQPKLTLSENPVPEVDINTQNDNWGFWDSSADSPIVGRFSNGNRFNLTEGVYYIVAEPSRPSTGYAYYSSDQGTAFAGHGTGGQVVSVNSSFDVDFDTGIISYGLLSVNMADSTSWQTNYSGQVSANGLVNISTENSYQFDNLGGENYANSNMSGLFTDNGGLYLGNFDFSTTLQWAQGVFELKPINYDQ